MTMLSLAHGDSFREMKAYGAQKCRKFSTPKCMGCGMDTSSSFRVISGVVCNAITVFRPILCIVDPGCDKEVRG
jgi:hypothetical protein